MFPTWLLTLALAGVTALAFLWAVSSSRGGAPQPAKMKKKRSAGPGRAKQQEMADAGGFGGARAPAAPAPHMEPAAAAARGQPNALAWATFGVSAFGTLSSFVFSVLTYLRSS